MRPRAIACYSRRVRSALPLALALGACHLLEPPPERAPPPDLTLTRVTLEQYRNGALVARGQLAEVRYQRDAARANATGVTLSPTAATGPAGTVRAGTADAQLRTGAVELAGGVSYETGERDRFETATASLDLARHTAVGADPVVAKGDGYTLESAGFRSDFGSERQIELTGGVRARVEPPPAPAPPKAPKKPARRGGGARR